MIIKNELNFDLASSFVGLLNDLQSDLKEQDRLKYAIKSKEECEKLERIESKNNFLILASQSDRLEKFIAQNSPKSLQNDIKNSLQSTDSTNFAENFKAKDSKLDFSNYKRLENCALDFFIQELKERLNREKIQISLEKTKQNGSILKLGNRDISRILWYFFMKFGGYLDCVGLFNFSAAVGEYLQKYANAFDKEYKKIAKWAKNAVVLAIVGYTNEDKHTGKLAQILRQKSNQVAFICNEKQRERLEWLNSCFCLDCGGEMVEVFGAKISLLSAGNQGYCEREHRLNRTKIAILEHNFCNVIEILAWHKQIKHFYNSTRLCYLRGVDFVLANTKNESILLAEVLRYFGALDIERSELCKDEFINKDLISSNCDFASVLNAGSPSFDFAYLKFQNALNNALNDSMTAREREQRRDLREIDSIDSIKSKNINNAPLLVIVPNFLAQLESVFVAISKLLQNGWKIIFRPHPAWIDSECESFKDQISQWQKEGDFSVDKSRIYFREYFLSCVGILTDGSSMGSSFPLVSGKVAIRFLKSKQHIKHEIYGIKWVNPFYNIAVFSNDELLNALMFLNNKEVQNKFAQNIKNFRNEQIYNLGKSAEFIADFMLKF